MFTIFSKGIFKQNPLLVQLLGMCPALATTSDLQSAVGMGCAFTVVLIGSNCIISMLRSIIPSTVRIPCYIVIIASLVTSVEMLMQAFTPDIHAALGIFIPLIVVNCIVLARAELYASKNAVLPSLLDAIGMGLGFTLALCLRAGIREFLGAGSLLGYKTIFANWQPIGIMILPAGAFITLGFIIAALNCYKERKQAGGDTV